VGDDERKVPEEVSDEDFNKAEEAMLIASARMNKKLEKWLEQFKGIFPCTFCGLEFSRDNIVLHMQDTPVVSVKKGESVNVKKDVFLACIDCTKEIKAIEELDTQKIVSQNILSRQIDFLEKSSQINIEDIKRMNRGEAIKEIGKIVNEYRNKRRQMDSTGRKGS